MIWTYTITSAARTMNLSEQKSVRKKTPPKECRQQVAAGSGATAGSEPSAPLGAYCCLNCLATTWSKKSSVPIVGALEWSPDWHTDVVCLLLGQNRHLGTPSWEVQRGHFFVQSLWKKVDIVLVRLRLFPVLQEVQLREHLICEGARHHKRRVTSGAAQVEQSPSRKHDDAVPVGEHEAVHLWLNVLDRHARHALKPSR